MTPQYFRETPCEHGRMKFHEWGWLDNGQSCPGGVRQEVTIDLAEVFDDDPLTWSTEGLDDVCFFCGADAQSSPDWTRFAEHKSNCPWIMFRITVGLPLGAHTVVEPVDR